MPVLLLVLLLSFFVSSSVSSSLPFVLTSGGLQLSFGPSSTGFALQGVSSTTSVNVDFFAPASSRAVRDTLFQVTFVRGGGSTELYTFDSADAGHLCAQVSASLVQKEGRLAGIATTITSAVLTYANCKVGDGLFSASVQVQASSTLASATEWAAQLQTQQSQGLAPVQFSWTQLANVGKDLLSSKSPTKLFRSSVVGQVYSEPQVSYGTSSSVYPSSAMTMQFMSFYYDDSAVNSGLYFGTHDPSGFMKTFSVDSHTTMCHPSTESSAAPPLGNCSLSLVVASLFPGAGQIRTGTWSLPYVTIVAAHSGTWFEAALLYRSWAQQKADWVVDAASYPERVPASFITDSALWVNTGWTPVDGDFNIETGNPDVVLSKMKTLRSLLAQDDLTIALHWYMWFEAPGFDRNYPRYSPIKSGFKDTVALLSKSFNTRTYPYINGRLFDLGIPEWKSMSASKWVSKKTPTTAYVTTPSLLSPWVENYMSPSFFGVMCPHTEFWQNTIAAVVQDTVREQNVAGMYIDQIAAASAKPCWDPTHNHTLGGGNYWRTGYRELLRQASAPVAAKASQISTIVPIVTEEMAEVYMDSVTAYLCIMMFDIGGPQAVPAMQVVYGGNFTCVGQLYDPLDFFSGGDLFASKIAASLRFGAQLGWFSMGNAVEVLTPLAEKSNQPLVDFMKSALHIRKNILLDFVTRGRATVPVVVKSATPLPIVRGISQNFTAVEASAWLSADSTSCLLLVDDSVRKGFNVTLEFQTSRVQSSSFVPPFKLFSVDSVSGTRKFLQSVPTSEFIYNFDIDARSFALFELVASS